MDSNEGANIKIYKPRYFPERTTNVRKKTITLSEGRKQRSDKKNDVKIPLTQEQRIMIRELAEKANMSPTSFCGYLLKKGLVRRITFPEPKLPYPSGSSLSFPAKLEMDFYLQLKSWAIKWDCSIKKAAYRILVLMLALEKEEGAQ